MKYLALASGGQFPRWILIVIAVVVVVGFISVFVNYGRKHDQGRHKKDGK